jgi:hypothetical protein
MSNKPDEQLERIQIREIPPVVADANTLFEEIALENARLEVDNKRQNINLRKVFGISIFVLGCSWLVFIDVVSQGKTQSFGIIFANSLRHGHLGWRGRTMESGQYVEVTQYGGDKAVRRVVADLGRTIVVCNEAEYGAATQEKRKPEGIGFPRKSVKPLSRQ